MITDRYIDIDGVEYEITNKTDMYMITLNSFFVGYITKDGEIQQNISPHHPEVITFQKRIVKHMDYLLTFLYHHEVPAHNNSSEQAIRNIKVKLNSLVCPNLLKALRTMQSYVPLQIHARKINRQFLMLSSLLLIHSNT